MEVYTSQIVLLVPVRLVLQEAIVKLISMNALIILVNMEEHVLILLMVIIVTVNQLFPVLIALVSYNNGHNMLLLART